MSIPTNALRSRGRALLVVLVALALAACTPPGGGGDVDDEAPGTLVVVVNGLPAGAAGSVSVSGPSGFADTVTSSETFVGLEPGNYSVSASTLSHEGVEYTASVSGSPAAVTSNAIATATVTYAATSTAPGDLTVSVSGLPLGVDADVEVTGPSGFDESLTASVTFLGVDPGTYTVSASSVNDGGDIYAPTVSGSPAVVPAGSSATATVTYTFLDPDSVGTLQVDIDGLPAGALADVNVSGSSVDQDLTASATIPGLAPGNYTVTGANVSHDGLTYAASVTGSPALVLPAETATVRVLYQPFVANDLDSSVNPGVFAQFRNTSPGPVWVDEMLFNQASVIDTKGIQLRNEVADPADPTDWLHFRLVHGQGNSTTISVTLECVVALQDGEEPTNSVIRADVRTTGGNKIGQSVLCGTTRSISIPNVGGATNQLVEVYSPFSDPFYARYVLSINAYCFQTCDYQPFDP